MAFDLRPSKDDPLFAADTPIMPDPTPGPKGSSKGYAAREAMIARLVAAGYTPAEAAKVVDAELARSGPRPEGLWAQDNSPAGMANLRQGIANQRASERRMGAFQDNYNEATGAPAAPDIAPPSLDPDMVPLTAQQLRELGLNPYEEPGVNMPDGTRAVGPRQIQTERDARAYNTRPSDGNGGYKPSPRDEANADRGLFPVWTPDGGVAYTTGTGGRPMYSEDPGNVRGAPGRLGVRKDLEEKDSRTPGFVLDRAEGPTGSNYTYQQNDAARAQQSAYMRERQLYRDAAIQGVSPAALLAASPGDYGDLTAGGIRGRVNARVANEGARQAGADRREEAWRAQMMLGGGRPTGGIGGSKAIVNSYNQLGDPNVSNWQKAVMANALRPDMDNTTPLTVDAMGAQNAMRLLNSTNLGAAGLGNPAAAQAQQMYSDKRRTEAIAAAEKLAAKLGTSLGVTPAVRRRIRDRIEAEFPGHGDAAAESLPLDEPALPPDYADPGREPDGMTYPM